MKNLAVLIACYNRKAKTLAALEMLRKQEGLSPEIDVKVYVVDDNSSDGTSVAINEHFPKVRLIQGTGSLYWNGGMRLAFGEALKESCDYYLWLNDDTTLFPNALEQLIGTSIQLNDKAIVVASLKDPYTSLLTYGGVGRFDCWRPLRFTLIEPKGYPIPVETMNGNCVLIPHAVTQKVGNLDPAFTHAIGDFDYGLRASKLGIDIYIASGYYGYCQRNLHENRSLPLGVRLKKKLSPHGLPPREWAVFVRRYAGPLWFVYWTFPYIRSLLKK